MTRFIFMDNPKFGAAGISWILIILGIVARVLSIFDLLCIDCESFCEFASQASAGGLLSAYDGFYRLNHPPLTIFLLGIVQGAVSCPDKITIWTFKILGLLADGTIAFCVYQFSKIRGAGDALYSLGVYAASIPIILISAYHGNSELVVAAILGLALICFSKKRPAFFWSGLLAGLALSIKLTFVLSAIVLAIGAIRLSARSLAKFLSGLVAGSFTLLLFFALHSSQAAKIYSYRPAFTKNSILGLTYFVESPDYLRDLAQALSVTVREYSLFLVLIAVIYVSIRATRHGMHDSIRLCLCVQGVALLVAPQLPPHYLIWVLPLMYWHNPRFAALLSIPTAIFCVDYYVERMLGYRMFYYDFVLIASSWSTLLMLSWWIYRNLPGKPSAGCGYSK